MTEKERETKTKRAAAAALPRSPTEKPPFTLAEIKKAIPARCFERSLLRSSAYLLRDLAIAGCLLWFALAGIPALPLPVRLVAWPLYWVVQGCVLFGVWVIAHECGHGAFSDHQLLNDALGLALHSALLAPYFSWKYSHLRHHSNTGSLDRDEVYVPRRRVQLPWYTPHVYKNDHPGARLALLAVQLTVGWPMYLAFNTWGRDYPRWASHFDPYAPIYTDRERAQVALSDAGLLAAALALYGLAAACGFWWVARVYGAPLVVVNAWLVVVTYLPTPRCRTTTPPGGTGCAARSPPSTATTASSAAPSSTTSPTRTSRTTFSPPSRTTTPWRPPRPSAPSSATTTASTPRHSSRRSGARSRSASTSSLRRTAAAKTAPASTGTATSSRLLAPRVGRDHIGGDDLSTDPSLLSGPECMLLQTLILIVHTTIVSAAPFVPDD